MDLAWVFFSMSLSWDIVAHETPMVRTRVTPWVFHGTLVGLVLAYGSPMDLTTLIHGSSPL